MRKFGKKITAALIAGIMAIMMCVPAFAAEVETPNDQVVAPTAVTLENPRFVGPDGNELNRNMGKAIIDTENCTIDSTGNIKIPLQEATIGPLTGRILHAYLYVDGVPNMENDLVANGFINVNEDFVEQMPANGSGIHMMLVFDFNTDVLPPGMNTNMEVYFTW